MAQNRGRQKQLAKKKKARTEKRKATALERVDIPTNVDRLLNLISKQPFGPSYLSVGWDDPSEPEIVTAVVTRRLPDGSFLPGIALVDRTCLGVKNATVGERVNSADLPHLVEMIFAAHPEGGAPADLLTVQSVVYNAIDYARKLGFKPHRDFADELFGPRPEVLLDTAWAHSPKPMYYNGPHDDYLAVLAQLQRVVGVGNYESLITTGGGRDFNPFDDFDDGDDEDDDADDEDPPELP